MGVTRLEFIKGALVSLSFGAFDGRRLFAAPLGWKHGGTPNVVFGVLSDTHLRTGAKSENPGANWPDKYFVAALRYFKDCNVDAVVHCGDMAHRGQTWTVWNIPRMTPPCLKSDAELRDSGLIGPVKLLKERNDNP